MLFLELIAIYILQTCISFLRLLLGLKSGLKCGIEMMLEFRHFWVWTLNVSTPIQITEGRWRLEGAHRDQRVQLLMVSKPQGLRSGGKVQAASRAKAGRWSNLQVIGTGAKVPAFSFRRLFI